MTVNRIQIVSAGFTSNSLLIVFFVISGWFEGLSQKFLSASASKMLLLAG